MNILKNIYNIFKSFIIQNRLKKADYILNDGERYDPVVNGWIAKDHINRYKFAWKFLTKKDTVLDIACGTGYGSAFTADACRTYIGIDKHKGAIEYGIRKYGKVNIRFFLSDLFKYMVPADIVISFETIEHIKAENVQMVLDKLLSLTRKILIGSVPYKEKPGNNKHHYFFNLDESFFEYLRQYGELSFYYQDDGGIISQEKSGHVKQLIFVLKKKEKL